MRKYLHESFENLWVHGGDVHEGGHDILHVQRHFRRSALDLAEFPLLNSIG